MDVIEDCKLWRLNLELMPRNPHGKARMKKEEDEFRSYVDTTILRQV